MYNLKLVTFYFFCSVFVIAFSGCQEDVFTHQEVKPLANTTIADQGNGSIGGYKAPNEQEVPYPTIIKQTFIPSNPLFATMKCLAWKITWPVYAAGTNPEKIPTVMKTSNGALHSIYYLNNTHPQNTLSADFSLYHHNKLEAAVTMWEELDHRDVSMKPVYFYKTAYSIKTIEGWVKERPQLFETNWQSSIEMEASYQAGDIFLYRIELIEENKNFYGAIRIVSVTPRVIEVYMGVPNI
ncbi:hypothetical protein Q0590_31350 [Rhodocytophaga aerolata]|uniref:Uncharacterized protein n=1 Tax=Rhodocytophaga aerolata TaxID=455078 RepID=A0ABT8RFC5_9BACT|nr:hypothetical protein [Rhodocytophaga aerolata]MDO1450812.1 hypothetical protein [Rhodocytophaga aerolata]